MLQQKTSFVSELLRKRQREEKEEEMEDEEGRKKERKNKDKNKTENIRQIFYQYFNPSNVELNSICHLLALLGAHHILHVSRIRANCEGCRPIERCTKV
jgi:hypothetical protein